MASVHKMCSNLLGKFKKLPNSLEMKNAWLFRACPLILLWLKTQAGCFNFQKFLQAVNIYKKPTKWLDEICNKLINQYKHQNFILKTDILYYQHPSWHFYHSLQITPLKFKKRKKVVLGEAGQSSKSLEAAGSRW